jgi:hypothetical protein
VRGADAVRNGAVMCHDVTDHPYTFTNNTCDTRRHWRLLYTINKRSRLGTKPTAYRRTNHKIQQHVVQDSSGKTAYVTFCLLF